MSSTRSEVTFSDNPQQSNIDRRGALEEVSSKVEITFIDCAMCRESGTFYGCVKFSVVFKAWSAEQHLYMITADWGTKPSIYEKANAAWWNKDATVAKWNSSYEGMSNKQLPVNLSD